MIIGDFNLHHPSWGGDQAKADSSSNELLDITELLSMDQLLPVGTPTFIENCSTTIDLVFATPGIGESLIRCGVAEHLNAHSDHQLVLTTIDAALKDAPPRKVRIWKKTNPKTLNKKLKECIEANHNLKRILAKQAEWIRTPEHLDQVVEDLTSVINKAIEASTPLGEITARSKIGFDEACKEAQMEVRRLKKRYLRAGTEES